MFVVSFNLVKFVVLTVITVLIGSVSPPVGIVVFALAGMVRDMSLSVIFRGVMPFIGAMLVCLVILVVFPQITLWLPGMMKLG